MFVLVRLLPLLQFSLIGSIVGQSHDRAAL
jgi:hypothetical protein